jgi:NitT/TauT family transport system permease protein
MAEPSLENPRLVEEVGAEAVTVLGADVSAESEFRFPSRLRQALSFLIIAILLALAWEGAKFIGGDPWNFSRADGAIVDWHWQPPLSIFIASDLNMPHLWDIGAAFFNPAQRNGPPLLGVLLGAATFTLQEAVVGFILGAVLGFCLGVVFAHSPLLERGLVPYVVASQTVPILAIAPMVVAWLQSGWVPVALIAAYLTFFPVTINTLRGLRAPDPRALELMRSYAATRWATLWKVRFPAALPYIFTALKISATTAVVGAIIGELPSGITTGLGGAILNFSRFYISGPPKLWATIIGAAAVGILFFVAIVVAERIALRNVVRET